MIHGDCSNPHLRLGLNNLLVSLDYLYHLTCFWVGGDEDVVLQELHLLDAIELLGREEPPHDHPVVLVLSVHRVLLNIRHHARLQQEVWSVETGSLSH